MSPSSASAWPRIPLSKGDDGLEPTLAQVACGDGYGVTTGRDAKLARLLISGALTVGLPIPLARLELCGHLARRLGRRAQRPTLAQSDLAPRPLPLYT